MSWCFRLKFIDFILLPRHARSHHRLGNARPRQLRLSTAMHCGRDRHGISFRNNVISFVVFEKEVKRLLKMRVFERHVIINDLWESDSAFTVQWVVTKAVHWGVAPSR